VVTIAALLVGLLVGAVAVWLALRERIRAEQAAAASERRLAHERLAVAERSHAELRAQFPAMAAQALRDSQTSLLELAGTRLDGHVAPLKESLEKVESRVRELDQARRQAFGALENELRSLQASQERLRTETGNLVTALRAPHVRGRWGEVQLKRVVEVAGMLAHCDFDAQVSTRDEEGSLRRPDLVVTLPGGKRVVVDAKVPLAAYLDACAAEDEDRRLQSLQQHARQLREHIVKLGAKGYWKQFEPAPDFVVMFLPDETFLRAAAETDPAIIEDAWKARVIPASPNTLLTLLRTVAITWQQETAAQSAREVHELGQELYDRLRTMAGHVHRLGQSLKSSVNHFNQTVGALESRVLVTGRKLQQHGIGGEDLPEVEPVELQPRQLAAPELVDAVESAPRALDAA
jgi:DNA recombination protein RmuC